MVTERDKVLVVEDDEEIRELITLQLQRDGYLIEALSTGEEAVNKITSSQYNLIVLDWMLPGVSGLELARIIRNKSNQKQVPILMVTARVEAGDIISGLEAGADDYVTKPFDTSVFLARVRSLLRRSKFQNELKQSNKNEITIGLLNIDVDAHEVCCGDETLHLTPSEFKLLHTLALQAGKVLTREALINEVQGTGVSVVDRAIDTHVFGLRKKMGVCADILETVRGVGYRIRIPDLELQA